MSSETQHLIRHPEPGYLEDWIASPQRNGWPDFSSVPLCNELTGNGLTSSGNGLASSGNGLASGLLATVSSGLVNGNGTSNGGWHALEENVMEYQGKTFQLLIL
jgi:hypothetical protein